jgi:hypothetical protein
MRKKKTITIYTACANPAGGSSIQSTELAINAEKPQPEDYFSEVENQLMLSGFRKPFVHFSGASELETIVEASRLVKAESSRQPVVIAIRSSDGGGVELEENPTGERISLRDYEFAGDMINEDGLEKFLETYGEEAQQDANGNWYFEKGDVVKMGAGKQDDESDFDIAPAF